jgi:choline transport protein
MSLSGKHRSKGLGQQSPELGEHSGDETVAAVHNGTVINASGYKDQLRRQYGLLGLAGIALTVDNAWVALGSSISVSIGTLA